MRPKIYRHNGKDYIRRGECIQCGECCLGWAKPCPMLELLGPDRSRCRIHDRLIPDNQEVKDVTGVSTTACYNFPTPGDFENLNIRNKCGYYFVEMPKILVACAVHEMKEYSFQRWIDNVKSFTYPNFEILCVDNSPDTKFMDRYKDQVPMVHIDIEQDTTKVDASERITKSMAVIQRHFMAGDFERWFNLECDVIPPKDIIEFLLEHGKDADWVSHCYPNREDKTNVQQGIGCSLLKRSLFEDGAFDYETADSPDAWLWELVRKSNRFHTCELWQYLPIEHLAH